jgi:hypothetical protein
MDGQGEGKAQAHRRSVYIGEEEFVLRLDGFAERFASAKVR